LLNRQPIQVTLHLVDSGIDTGPVLQRVTIPVLAGDTIQSVIDRTISTSLDILVDAALSGPAGYGKPVPQDKNKGKQYFLMPFGLVRKLEEEWPDVIKSYEQSAKSHRPKGTHRNPAWSP
jgi:hypothetical protein